jgi:4-cresol dehydrogenase (hydroxylating)
MNKMLIAEPPENATLAVTLAPEALATLRAIVGERYVETVAQTREFHSRACIPETTTCAAVVHPGSTDELRRIVVAAAHYKLRLWTFGGGNNWGYGTKNAAESGAVVLLLHRMNRILEVNEKLAYAVVEPGVTQQQLSEYLQEKHPKLWLDVNDATPRANVIGNGLERGYGCTTHGDHFAQLCGLEVVLPDGELLRTGGPVPNNRSLHTHKWGCGPYLEGLFSQSNLGIVVKAGVWLLPKPECFKMFTFALNEEANLPEVVERLRELALHKQVQSHTHMANTLGMLSVVAPYPWSLLREGETFLSDEVLAGLRRHYGVGAWMLAGGLYGTKAEVCLHKKAVIKKLGPLGRVQFFDARKAAWAVRYLRLHERFPEHPLLRIVERVRRLVFPEHLAVLKTLPGEFNIHQGITDECVTKMAYFKVHGPIPAENLDPARDGGGVICHAPAVPATGKDTSEILNLVRPLFRKHGFDFFGCLTKMNERTNFLLTLIYFDQRNPEEKARAKRLFNELSEATDQAGFQSYRCGVMHYASLSRRSPVWSRFVNELKQTVDPHGVMAPGRYGMGK